MWSPQSIPPELRRWLVRAPRKRVVSEFEVALEIFNRLGRNYILRLVELY